MKGREVIAARVFDRAAKDPADGTLAAFSFSIKLLAKHSINRHSALSRSEDDLSAKGQDPDFSESRDLLLDTISRNSIEILEQDVDPVYSNRSHTINIIYDRWSE
jgi:hypothetical protein